MFTTYLKLTSSFIFWYPFAMSLFWIAGSIIFYFSKERNKTYDFESCSWPMISILIPCYNEAETICETISSLSKLSYPQYEIIAVNDGSTDNTGDLLFELCKQYKQLRVVDCLKNCGKANALHIATFMSHSEYLLCIDSDAFLDDLAPYYLIYHFLKDGERVGAVTGNPRIRNRKRLLAKLQIVEYASIIGAIKRTQRIVGKIMTVSGVVVAFRKKALVDVGMWDRDMITEDIAISWKLQRSFWNIHYEPKALCWMLVPETLSGLWKQRIRWAQGGQEVLLRNWKIFCDLKQRRLWPIYLEQVFSSLWSLLWFCNSILSFFLASSIKEYLIWFSFTSFSMVMLCSVQLLVSLIIDSEYDYVLPYYLWAAWYPAIYWMVNSLVVVSAIPQTIRSRLKGGYAVWNSPDRGIKS